MTELDLLLEAMRRNARANEFLIDELSDADLALSDGKGGMTVAQMLSHMGVSRGGWLQEMSPEYAVTTKTLTDGQFIWGWQSDDRNAIKAMLKAGDQAAIQAVQAHLQRSEPFADPRGVGTFQANPAHFLVLMLVHDGNHRGQIVALMRQSGASPERLDKLEEQWDIWRE